MGVTTYACAGCGQAQRKEHPNGEAPEIEPCARCKEIIKEELEAIVLSKASKREQILSIALTLQRYGAPEQDAQNAARLYYAQAHSETEKGAAV